MKISAKGRYGLAAMTYLARNYAAGTPITIVSISEKLGISKIYLEQVFSMLKRARPSIPSRAARAAISWPVRRVRSRLMTSSPPSSSP